MATTRQRFGGFRERRAALAIAFVVVAVWSASSGVGPATASVGSPPSVTYLGASGQIGQFPWYNTDVSVFWLIEDNGSPISSTSGCVPLLTTDTGPEGVVLTCSATNEFGTTTAASLTAIFRDATPPLVTVVPSRLPDSGSWYRSSVTFEATGTDALSGMAEFGCNSLAYGPSKLSAAGIPFLGQCVDVAGNIGTQSFTFDFDSVPPSISTTVSGTTDDLGQYIGSALVHSVCSDSVSGIATCPADQVVTATGVVPRTAVDHAGNSTSSPVSVTVVADVTPPTIAGTLAPDPAASGWWNIATGPPTASFVCTDTQTPITSCPGPHLFGEGADQTLTVTSTDSVPNTATLTLSDIDVDLTAPSIIWDGGPGDGATYEYDAVPGAPTCTTTDPLSGPGDCSVSGYATALGLHTLSASAVDMAGNPAAGTRHYTVVDTTSPTLDVVVSPERPASGWWSTTSGAPIATFTCNDPGSGMLDCPGPHVFGEGENQTLSVLATDNALNTTPATVSDIDVDMTAPDVGWSGGPVPGASYVFGTVPAAPTCTVTDTLSGPSSCVVTGYSTAVGLQVMTATATDLAGNTSTSLRSYTVTPWTLIGFDKPLVNSGASVVFNGINPGHTATLKFEVFALSTELTSASTVSGLTTTAVTCAAFPTDLGSPVATSAAAIYKAGRFNVDWVAPGSSGACVRVTVTTLDGSTLSVWFRTR